MRRPLGTFDSITWEQKKCPSANAQRGFEHWFFDVLKVKELSKMLVDVSARSFWNVLKVKQVKQASVEFLRGHRKKEKLAFLKHHD